ncbi:MAG: FAD-binding oxidoreductase [Candidatus Bilamarchaeaceae archaeon]
MEKYRIMDIRTHEDGIRVIQLVPLAGRLFTYKPGNFLILHLLDEKGESIDKRPYSIASSPTQGYIELAIKMIGGRFTSKLEKLKEGDIVGVEGPLGHFTYDGQNKCVFIAGGVGVAPFMSMLRYIDATKKEGTFILFYSYGKRTDNPYREELNELSKNPNITIVQFLTREMPAGWNGEIGRIDEARIGKYVKSPKEFRWYICGPPQMCLTLRDVLTGMGVPSRKIKLESWGTPSPKS